MCAAHSLANIMLRVRPMLLHFAYAEAHCRLLLLTRHVMSNNRIWSRHLPHNRRAHPHLVQLRQTIFIVSTALYMQDCSGSALHVLLNDQKWSPHTVQHIISAIMLLS